MVVVNLLFAKIWRQVYLPLLHSVKTFHIYEYTNNNIVYYMYFIEFYKAGFITQTCVSDAHFCTGHLGRRVRGVLVRGCEGLPKPRNPRHFAIMEGRRKRVSRKTVFHATS